MPIRYRIVGLVTLGTMLNYVDRINISVAATDIMRDTGWDTARFGWVFSAFLIGYALFQYPGGAAADRWSARKVIGLSCLGFSLFTALTPIGQGSFALFLVLRFLVGSFESVSFPAFASLNSRWFPGPEFARAQAMLLSGVFLGQMVAFPTTTWIIQHYSWEMVFYANALVGVLWVSAWLWYVRDTPREHPKISAREIDRIEAGAIPKTEAKASLRAILRCRPVLYVCMSYMLYGYVAWFFIFWFPTYLREGRDLGLMEMGLVGMLPIAAGFLGVQSGGWLSDLLLKRGVSARLARVQIPGFCIMVAGPFLMLGVLVESVWVCVACFALFYFLYSAALPGYWALPLELSPRFVGSIVGVMNTSANLMGLLGPVVGGYMAKAAGSWESAFQLSAGLAVVCGGIYAFFVSTDPIDVEAPTPGEAGL